MVQISFIMVISMLVNIPRGNLMERANINGRMEILIPVNSSKA